ncbi:MAG: PQQ-binding-like beta-propeller repeat protein [Acidimicrobiales bacterium]|nr:PQQ-binding-like beta-propeller repeat protein [Acidimicrobiales bacterium]
MGPLAIAAIAVVVIIASLVAIGTAAVPAASSAATDPAGWTVYHHDAAGSGVTGSVSAVDSTQPKWASTVLDGQLYGEPLVSGGRVYMATENDTVYALSATDGAVVWERHLGSPVPASSLPCGNIQPTVGITGTPVIDESRGELFAVADEVVGGRSAHVLVGLSVASGKTEMTQDVDPGGVNTDALLQRTGLTLDAGQVIFGLGGNYGDCSTYRGRVVAVNESGGPAVDFTVDAGDGQDKGAIWMGGGAPAVDGSGNIWVGVGNGSVTSAARAYDYSDSVLELSPSLRLLQFFAPTSWASDNQQDLDLSMVPALLSNGQVIVAGKSRTAYLLNGARLGGIGGQLATRGSVCSDDIDGGSAVVGTVAYLPCLSGVIAVQADASPARLRMLWSSGTGGGPPIVAAGLVWTIGQNGVLYGLNPGTGAVQQQASVGTPANHFPTPSAGDGLLLAAAQDRVVAFAASSPGATATTAPAAATTIPGSRAAQNNATTSTASKGPSSVAEVVVVLVGLAVVGSIGWLLWRRRTAKSR